MTLGHTVIRKRGKTTTLLSKLQIPGSVHKAAMNEVDFVCVSVGPYKVSEAMESDLSFATYQ